MTSSSEVFSSFYTEVKAIEKQDSKLTSKDQIDRLLRPGSTYFNLNPYEVLLLDHDVTVEVAKKQFKKMSILCHPDKNQDNRERADQAFGIIKKAIATIEDPDELDKCKNVVEEAMARTRINMEEKRKQRKKEGKPQVIEEDDPHVFKQSVRTLTTKLFADRERKKKQLELRANDEKKRKAEDDIAESEKKKLDLEFQKNYEESREERVGQWKNFVTKKEKKGKVMKGAYKPPKPKPEKRL